MLVSCLWIIAVNGTVSAEILAGQTGTALTVLEKLIGPIANWLGSAFIVLSLGLGCVHFSLGLFFLIDERIPLHSENKGAKRSHFILCAFPAIGAFLVAEWLLINNVGSFTGLLGFVGIMTLPLVAGVYPILLLASTRRKGDIVPGLVLKGIGNPIVLAGTYLLFIGSIFLHGLYAFQGVLEKTIILLVGCIVVVMTGIMLKQRALTSRLVIEIRQDLSGFQRVIFNLTAKGYPIVSDVRLDYGDRINDLHTAYDQIPDFFSLNLIRFQLPVIAVDEVKVWAHKISAQGKSEALPIQGSIQIADNLRRIDLSQNDGLEQFTVKKEPCNYEFQLWFTKKI
jgi:hypothetical protein